MPIINYPFTQVDILCKFLEINKRIIDIRQPDIIGLEKLPIVLENINDNPIAILNDTLKRCVSTHIKESSLINPRTIIKDIEIIRWLYLTKKLITLVHEKDLSVYKDKIKYLVNGLSDDISSSLTFEGKLLKGNIIKVMTDKCMGFPCYITSIVTVLNIRCETGYMLCMNPENICYYAIYNFICDKIGKEPNSKELYEWWLKNKSRDYDIRREVIDR